MHRRFRFVLLALGMLSVAAFAWFTGPTGSAHNSSPMLMYPPFPATPTVPVAPLQSQLSAATLARFSFADSSMSVDWHFHDLQPAPPGAEAVWQIVDGSLLQLHTAAAGNPSLHETLALTGDPAWNNYRVTVQFYDEYNGSAGLVARWNKHGFYRYRVLATTMPAGHRHVLEKVVNGVAVPLAVAEDTSYTPRHWHTLSLIVDGATIEAAIDGNTVVAASDTEFHSGQTGVYTRAAGGIRFDNLTVVEP